MNYVTKSSENIFNYLDSTNRIQQVSVIDFNLGCR